MRLRIDPLSYHCPLGRRPASDRSPEDLERIKSDGWKDLGILVISVDDPRLSWVDKELIRQIGNRLYNAKKSMLLKKGRKIDGR
jgi:hypothetical protein